MLFLRRRVLKYTQAVAILPANYAVDVTVKEAIWI